MTRYRFFSLVFLWGNLFFLFGGMPKAQEAGSSVTALGFPESAEAVRAFSTGDEARAYALLTPLSASNSAYPPPGVLIALLCSNRGDYEGMHRALGRAVLEQPLDPEPYFQLADVAIQEMRLVEATLLLERGSALLENFGAARTIPSEEDVRLLWLRNLSDRLTSRLLEEKGDLAGAEESIRRILERAPKSVAACRSLGWLLLVQNRLDEAEKTFDRMAALDPTNPPGWLESALLLDERGQSAEAKKIADEHFTVENAKNSDEKQERVLLPVIRLYLKWNRLDEARKLIETLDDRSAERHKLAGRLSLYDERFSEAEAEYQKALFLTPDDFQAQNGYALALAEQGGGKLRQANDLARENQKRYPNSQEAAASLGWTELLLGRTDRSETLFAPILESGSFTPTTAYYLAESALGHEDQELALTLLHLALDQEENFPKRAAAEKLLQELTAEQHQKK